MSLEDDMFNFNESRPVNDSDLSEVSRLADALRQKEMEIAAMEETLSNAKKELDRIKFSDLPLAMDKVGMAKFTMTDGRLVTVKPVVRLNINQERQEAAYAWLRENGAGPLIRNEVKATLDKGNEEQVAAVKTLLERLGVGFSIKESIPWNTLAAWAKEQLSEGVKLPADLLGLYQGREAVVKGPKKEESNDTAN